MIERSALISIAVAALDVVAALATQAAAGPPLAVETAASTPPTPQVEFFSPLGTSKEVRQVTARFSAEMVAPGDRRTPEPFLVRCAYPGRGRWADDRNWVYDFDEDLPGGIRCKFTLRPDVTTLAGAKIGGRREFSFDTGGPAIVGALPRDGWEMIDEEQVFLLKLDAPATTESVVAHAHCVVDGVGEEIPLRVLVGEERAAILRERALLGYDYFWLLWKSGTLSSARVRDRTFEQTENLIMVVRCARPLPPATQVRLVWGAGIASASGIATEQPGQLAYMVRPAFTAQVECSRANARSGCSPIEPVTVRFSAPIRADQAAGIRLLDGRGRRLQADAADVRGPLPVVEQVSFPGPFPEGETLRVELPADLHDEVGRTLANADRFPLGLRVDMCPPLAKFSGEFGILEAHEGGVLPVTLRNLESGVAAREFALPARQLRLGDDDPAKIAEWLRRVEQAARQSGYWEEVTRSSERSDALKPQWGDEEHEEGPESDPLHRHLWHERTGTRSVFEPDDPTARPFTLRQAVGSKAAQVIGIPLRNPGFYVVELASRALGRSLLGRDESRYVSTAALVTNLAVHFKWGRESSRVWVTRLDNGVPVAEADVAVTDYCTGAELWRGRTDGDGVAAITATLGQPNATGGCYPLSPPVLMVSARTRGDFSFTLSSWANGITPYQFSLPVGDSWQSDLYHTVCDRTLFRAGERISMKHFLRRHDLNGVALIPHLPAQRKVRIAHPGSGQSFDLEADFGDDGVAISQWNIPPEAKLGDYSIAIEGEDGQLHVSGRFKVEQFRLPSMRATVTGSPRPLVRPAAAVIDVHVSFLAGGGASGLPVKLRTFVDPLPMAIEGYEDYQFGGRPVTEGIVISANGPQDLDFEQPADHGAAGRVRVVPASLDAAGSARVSVSGLPSVDFPAQLVAELEYADSNGEILTSSTSVRLVPSAVTLGIRREGWVAGRDKLRFQVLALDLDGRPQAGQPVSVSLYQSTSYSYRKRLIGGFYAYETARETRRLAASCVGRTSAQGLVTCELAPGSSGEIIVRAETQDADGRLAGATTSVWIAGRDEWWFGGTAGDRMDLIPEKKEYSAGDVARFQVRMPFRSAAALVTVEREGVLSSFVTHLDGHEPVVEIPVGDAYAPNVFVSVLAVRGRTAHAEGAAGGRNPGAEVTALVDLNKPAYRLGVTAIKVDWAPHRLNVEVRPRAPSVAVRGQASVDIHVTRADGKPLPPGCEVAIAAVDEALLELAPNPTWSLLESMMGERGLEVWTSTAQMQVVGKRHYGRKEVPHGGGGGHDSDRTRELFDSLLLWQPRVAVSAAGRASILVPFNDSLSSFRIVAIAHAGSGLFGTGSATVTTTQDLILISGLPPVVREGDRYDATMTVRNTTGHAMTVRLAAEVKGRFSVMLDPQRVVLAGGASRDMTWPVTVPMDDDTLHWQVNAGAADSDASDAIRVSQKVIPAYPVRTYQATIAQLTTPLTYAASRPAGAIPGRGGLEVTLRARLGDGLQGVREFMSRYPYACLEQNLSRAVVLRDRALWNAWIARLPAYMDPDGLLRYFPSDRIPGDDTLTAYVLAVSDEAGWPLLAGDEERLVQALQRFVAGQIVRGSALPTADLTVRKLAAIEALSRHHAADVRMLDSVTIDPARWPTSAILDWLGILDRLNGLPESDAREKEALGILRARLNFQGTVMSFSTERSDALWWLMISTDSNANRMLLAVLARPEWRLDVPRLVRGALGRQQHGHWNTTVANAWGVLAMEKFSGAFESAPVTGTTSLRFGPPIEAVTWPRPDGVSETSLPWPAEGGGSVSLSHAGTGHPWAMVRATAALPLAQPLSTGFRIVRSFTAIEPHTPGHLTRGDVVRVRLELESQSDMSWVVVDDPIPAGSTILGSGLGGQSVLLARDEQRQGWAWLAYEERRFDAFRAYYRFVPKGKWTVEYTVRLNNPGTLLLPATRVEAMYAPEMFAEWPNLPMQIESLP